MRKYTPYASDEAKHLLRVLGNAKTSSHDYQDAFIKLGESLADVINPQLDPKDRILLAATSEDADWLLKGLFEKLNPAEKKIAVFWNERTNPGGKSPEFDLAPVVKSYIEEVKGCNVLVICKSIIYTSCVVRTNIHFLLEKFRPEKIVVASPVMFSGAKQSLLNEFESFRSKFEFAYFAEDDEVENGIVNPGIGGQVYQRLGLGDGKSRVAFIPELVKVRRAALSS